MSQIQIPNIRTGTDVPMKVRLTDSGVRIDWATLDNIAAYIYSEAQMVIAGKCSDIHVDPEDNTALLVEYPYTENQFLGVQSLVIVADYQGQHCTFDRKAFCFVATTDETGGSTTVEDDTVEVDITVDDVDSSILSAAIRAALEAADLAEEKADEANDAATLANEKAGFAQEQGEYAKAQGDYAKEQIDEAKGEYQTLDGRFDAMEETIPNDIIRTASDASFVHHTSARNTHLFYLREATTLLAGLMTASDKVKLSALPTAEELSAAILAITNLIPAQASAENQLADKAFVNSSISTATATFRGTFNLVNDLHLTISASQADIAAALASAISGADNNDYAFVQIPTKNTKPNEIARIDRYKYNGTVWSFEYSLNNSSFTEAQWAALNSGITSAAVAKLSALPTMSELEALLGGKINISDIVDNLLSDESTKPLSAKQGKVLDGKISQLGQELEKCPREAVAEVNADLEIADPDGKVLVRFSEGHIKTKNFDSRNSGGGGGTVEDYIYGDFALVDPEGNCLLKLSEGHLKTKNFDSRNVAFNYKNPYSETTIRFEVEVNVNMLKDVISTADLTDSQSLYTDRGLLMLPNTYTQKGTPTRLVIACHGAGGGVTDQDSQIENQTLYKYLVANGYAVMDMQGMPPSWVETWWTDYASYGLPAAKKEFVKVNNMGCPLAIECYIKGYQWVIEHYNIAQDGVFIAGASMGGLTSTNLVLSQRLPVLAQAGFAPVLDTHNQAFLHPWTDGVSKYALSKLYNFEVDGNNEFIYDPDKVCGYNPLINKMQTYHEGARMDSEGVYSFSNGTLDGQVIKEYHGYPCPLKIWHCVNDGTVSIACSARLISAIKNYGGSAWLRRFPTGGHAPDTAGTVVSNPIGNTILHGVSVGTIYPAAEELLLYFNRYNN